MADSSTISPTIPAWHGNGQELDARQSSFRIGLCTIHVFQVLTEVRSMISSLKTEYSDGPIDLSDSLDLGVGCIINSLLFGYRYDDVSVRLIWNYQKNVYSHARMNSSSWEKHWKSTWKLLANLLDSFWQCSCGSDIFLISAANMQVKFWLLSRQLTVRNKYALITKIDLTSMHDKQPLLSNY